MRKKPDIKHWKSLQTWARTRNTGIPLLGNKNEMLPFVTTWMELKGIMLRERKIKRCFHSHVEYEKVSTFTLM